MRCVLLMCIDMLRPSQDSFTNINELAPLQLSVLKPSRSEHENIVSFTTKWRFSLLAKSFCWDYFLQLELLKVSVISVFVRLSDYILISSSNFSLTLLSNVLSKPKRKQIKHQDKKHATRRFCRNVSSWNKIPAFFNQSLFWSRYTSVSISHL